MSPSQVKKQCSCEVGNTNVLSKCENFNQLTITKMLKEWMKYFQSRRWGLQMLIRMTLSEKSFIRHFIVFSIGVIVSLGWADQYISDMKAFIEFRTNILKKVNFKDFDNDKGSDKYLIPNFIHYIRLEQPEIRYDLVSEMKCYFLSIVV